MVGFGIIIKSFTVKIWCNIEARNGVESRKMKIGFGAVKLLSGQELHKGLQIF